MKVQILLGFTKLSQLDYLIHKNWVKLVFI